MFNNELWQKPAGGGGGGDFYTHQISNSVRLTKANSSLMSMTPGAAGDRKTWAFSFWVQRNAFGNTGNQILAQDDGGGGGAYSSMIRWDNDGHLDVSTGTTIALRTNYLFRDPNAFYHIVVAADTTQSTNTNRWKIYINGVDQTGNLSVANYPSQNYEFTNFGNQSAVFLNRDGNSAYSVYGNITLAEVAFVEGTASTASTFAETKNGVWIPKDLSGLTFGDEGFWLQMKNSAVGSGSSSTIGADTSGNNNHFSTTNIATHDHMLTSPTFNSDSSGGNFATMNQLTAGTDYPALAEGNLMMDSFSGSDISGALSTFALPPSSGKWYFECFINAPNSGDNYPFIGLTATQFGLSDSLGVSQRDLSLNLGTGGSEKNDTYVGSITTVFTGVSAYADNTVCGVFVDMDARKLWYAKDGAFFNSGNPQTGANPQYAWTNNVPLLPHFISFGGYGADSVFNFGQEGTFAGNIAAGENADVTGYGNFKYDPGDYKALCSGNIPTADAVDPAQTSDNFPQKLFGANLYTGTLSSSGVAQITHGLGFKPDAIWTKGRSTAQRHVLRDSIRGPNFMLEPNNNNAEADKSSNGDMGSTFATDTTYPTNYTDGMNGTGTYVGWSWRANGGTTSTNSTGSLSVTQQVDPSGSFSISTYNGDGGTDTIGHGLSSAPTMVIVKQRNGANNWAVYAKGAGATKYAYLDSGAAFGTAAMWQNTTPSSSLVYLGDNNEVNAGSRTYVAYCFADIEGYCKSGSYVGNASTDGTFVYTGFRPAWLMIKRVAAESWFVMDDKRDTYNVVEGVLQANGPNGESTTDYDVGDFLSNGFKLRLSDVGFNGAEDYVYLAFAENPFQYATAR